MLQYFANYYSSVHRSAPYQLPGGLVTLTGNIHWGPAELGEGIMGKRFIQMSKFLIVFPQFSKGNLKLELDIKHLQI